MAVKTETGKKRALKEKDIYAFRTEMLRALSDETRQAIILLLGKEGPLFVNEIAEQFSLSRPTISHHLSVLRAAHIVKATRKGKEIYYSLNVLYMRRALQSMMLLIDSIETIGAAKAGRHALQI